MIPEPLPLAMLGALIDRVTDQYGEKDADMICEFLQASEQTDPIYLSSDMCIELKNQTRAWQNAAVARKRKNAAEALADWIMDLKRAELLNGPKKRPAPRFLILRARAAARLHQVAIDAETHATEAFLIRCVQELTEAAYASTPIPPQKDTDK